MVAPQQWLLVLALTGRDAAPRFWPPFALRLLPPRWGPELCLAAGTPTP